jgi:tRNA A37 methylthiotransferase MiaB
MLSKLTKSRIKERKIHKHSNPSQLLKRVKDQSNQAIRDLTLIAENLEEEYLADIFTEEKLDPLIRALLNPKSKRAIEITEMLANCVLQKLVVTLPNEMVNDLAADIGKTVTYASLAKNFWNRPLIEGP